MTKDEALNYALQLVSNLRTHSWTVSDTQFVITAIKEALAQPEQEPVAWSITYHGSHCNNMKSSKELAEIEMERLEKKYGPAGRTLIPLYTTPPQRKPLTDEEIEQACAPLGAAMLSFTEVARAIEAAHGIKENT